MSRPHRKLPRVSSMYGAARRVVETLQRAGHIALFAGGCVRDMAMGRRPMDIDVATSAKPAQVVDLFPRTRQVGAAFGVVLVRVRGFDVEVATFRRDNEYLDGRHPESVTFADVREDGQRRDFTINGMFYDPVRHEVVDDVGGRDDIRRRLIRAIGDPDRRFAEDHLRMLRAIRFAARLDFTIQAKTRDAIARHAADLRRISPERIREELDLILSSAGRRRAFDEMRETGLLEHLWDGAANLALDADAVAALLGALPPAAPFELGLAAMVCPLPIDKVASACEALRCSNDSARTVAWLVTHRDDLAQGDDLPLAALKKLMAHPAFAMLVELFRARLEAGRRPMTAYEAVRRRVGAIPADRVAPPPLVTGHDLAALGVQAGPAYRWILDRVYDAQLAETLSDREAALAMVRQLAAQRE